MVRSSRWLLLCLALTGCDPVYPGEALGSFDVTGALDANECGQSAVPAVDPLSFAVELRVRDGQAFWRRPEAPLVSGSVTPAGEYRFSSRALIPILAPDPALGLAGCTLAQEERVQVRLEAIATPDAGAAEGGAAPGADGGTIARRLAGTDTIDFVPEPGSDCTPALAVVGGPFRALPCRVGYALHGEPREPF